jgi:hypothetical protein
MATPYDGPLPDEESDFADLRDSFYLLMNFNQYKMKPLISMTKEAEGLLRICLFSKSLKLKGSSKTLTEMRRKLAATLRSNRRRGVVPVFISTLWFLFSVGISIQSGNALLLDSPNSTNVALAFGLLGNNAQAHDLAMGLFVSWFPILIFSSIVDRNPVASDDIRRKLNKMIDFVCDALQDPVLKRDFILSFSDMPEAQRMAYWVEKISIQAPLVRGDFFAGFAGQARTRFHYGAAHAILLDIEKSYIAEHGRGWFMRNPRAARASLVLGSVDSSFVWFDGRQFWQISSSMLLIIGTAAGAFILSYFTPTVGLGCRTGGYLIFIVIATFLLIFELTVWFLTSPIRKNEVNSLIRKSLEDRDAEMVGNHRKVSFPGVAASKKTLSLILKFMEPVVIAIGVTLARLIPYNKKYQYSEKTEAAIRKHFKVLHGLTSRQWLERCIFTPLEFVNMAWLVYMLFAQTIGAFVNCNCQTSIWGPGGGYLDFSQWQNSEGVNLSKFWTLGTVISSVFMGIGMIYIVIEWCLQAHLSTESYKDAMNGLWRVRRFRRFTFWLRFPASFAVIVVNNLGRNLGIRKSRKRKTLIWKREEMHSTEVGHAIMSIAMQIHSMPFNKIVGHQEESEHIRTSGSMPTQKEFEVLEERSHSSNS